MSYPKHVVLLAEQAAQEHAEKFVPYSGHDNELDAKAAFTRSLKQMAVTAFLQGWSAAVGDLNDRVDEGKA